MDRDPSLAPHSGVARAQDQEVTSRRLTSHGDPSEKVATEPKGPCSAVKRSTADDRKVVS